jgi:hypothetical protein
MNIPRVGMKIMRERAERIGASVACWCLRVGQGTTVTLTLPTMPDPVLAGRGAIRSTVGLNGCDTSDTQGFRPLP